MKTMRFSLHGILILVLSCLLSGFRPVQAPGNTLTVTTLLDEYENPGPGAGCSLREAITAANTDASFGGCGAGSGIDTINIPPGTITFTRSGEDDANALGDLDILSSMILQGAGKYTTTLDADLLDRVIQINGYFSVWIYDLSLKHGKPPSNEGGGLDNIHAATTLTRINLAENQTSPGYSCAGIKNYGMMTIWDSVIESNVVADTTEATGVLNGGGICNNYTAALQIIHTSILYNHAGHRNNVNVTSYSLTPGYGGGIYNGGDLSIEQSLIADNYAGSISASAIDETHYAVGGAGGGIYNEGYLSVTNTTITGNHAGNATAPGGVNSIGGTGGALYNNLHTITLDSDTIVLNYAGSGELDNGYSGGISQDTTGTINLHNSILKNNQYTNAYCVGSTLHSQDYNILSDIACTVTGTTTHNQSGDPLLNPLANNGGLTLTFSLQPLSPAIDAGDPEICQAEDQRNVDRPADGNCDGTPVCDIGAYEFVPRAFFLPMIRK